MALAKPAGSLLMLATTTRGLGNKINAQENWSMENNLYLLSTWKQR
jgi:hypothetical protein